MRTILLLRSFGDFVIPLNVIRNSKNVGAIKFIASKHHQELFTSLPKELLPENLSITFEDYGIDKTLLRGFTNKYFFSLKSRIEILLLKKAIKLLQDENLYLEQKRRSGLLSFFVNHPFKSVVQNQNVYSAYAEFFDTELEKKSCSINQFIVGKKVLILPFTRQKRKDFPGELLQQILKVVENNASEVVVSYFKSVPNNSSSHAVSYSSFSELILQLQSSDFVICADSLPLHLAQFLNKPHFVFYDSLNSTQFFTPFALANNCHANFSELEKFKAVFQL